MYKLYMLHPGKNDIPAHISAVGIAVEEEGASRQGAVVTMNPPESADLLTREELLSTDEGRRALAACSGQRRSGVETHPFRHRPEFLT